MLSQPLQAGHWPEAGTARRQRTATAGKTGIARLGGSPGDARAGRMERRAHARPQCTGAGRDVARRAGSSRRRRGTAMPAQRRGLGKGLGALIPTGPPADVTIALPEHGTAARLGAARDSVSGPATGDPTRTAGADGT